MSECSKVQFSEPRRLYEARNWRCGAYSKVREHWKFRLNARFDVESLPELPRYQNWTF